MFGHDDMHDDQDLKDSILQELIERMEDVMSGRLKPAEKGLAVEVAAPDKEALKEGIEKAHDVLDQVPDVGNPEGKPMDGGDEKSDDERLAELMEEEGGEGAADEEGDEEDEKKR